MLTIDLQLKLTAHNIKYGCFFQMLKFIENLKNSDPFFEEIFLLAHKSPSLNSYQDYESLVLSNSENIKEKLVYSVKMCTEYPLKIRGYLAVFDFIKLMGFYQEANIFMSDLLQIHPNSLLVIKRLITSELEAKNISNVISLYIKYRSIIASDPNYLNIMQNYFKAHHIYNKVGITQETCDSKNTNNFIESINSEDFNQAIKILWIKYDNNNLSLEDLNRSIYTIGPERDNSERVLLFRRLAYKLFPNNLIFIINEIKTLMILKYEKQALRVLNAHLSNVMNSDNDSFIYKE